MGSIEHKSIFEYEDQSLVGPEKHSLDEAPLRALYSGGSDSYCPKVMRNTVVDSIKTVVFTSRLNLLMPFGPLAILVDRLTGSGHHVSCLKLFLHTYLVDFVFVYLYLKCISGLGLPFKLAGHHTFG